MTLKKAVREAIEAVERERIAAALVTRAGNVSRAALDLGISRKSLQTKMKQYGMRGELPTRAAETAPTWEPGTPLPEPPAVVGTRWIRLERDGGFALVDEDLHPMLSAYRWRRNDGGYARSGGTFLHHLVVGRPGASRRVDHINRNRLDCRCKNLRFATATQNSLNRGTPLPFGVDA